MSLRYDQVGVVYAIKLAEALFLWIALYLASNIIQQVYVSRVFVKNLDPPTLHRFVFTFLSIYLTFVVVLAMVVFLIKYMFEKPGVPFVIDGNTLLQIGGDIGGTTVLIILIGLVLAGMMMRKKYFRYKSDGLRAIRCLQELMLILGGIVLVIPFFKMLG